MAETVYVVGDGGLLCRHRRRLALGARPGRQFTLGDECDSINKILSTHPKLGNLLPGEASCFGVAPTWTRATGS